MTVTIGFVIVGVSDRGVNLVTRHDHREPLKPDEARALAAVLERMATESERLAAEAEDDEVQGRRCKLCGTEEWGIGCNSGVCRADRLGCHDWQHGVTVSKKRIQRLRA